MSKESVCVSHMTSVPMTYLLNTSEMNQITRLLMASRKILEKLHHSYQPEAQPTLSVLLVCHEQLEYVIYIYMSM